MSSMRYTTKVPKILAECDDKVTRVIHKAGFDVLALAQQRVPVDTGRLKGSATMVGTPMRAEIGYFTNYALYVHDGTRKMAPRPFLREPFDYVTSQLGKVMREVVEP